MAEQHANPFREGTAFHVIYAVLSTNPEGVTRSDLQQAVRKRMNKPKYEARSMANFFKLGVEHGYAVKRMNEGGEVKRIHAVRNFRYVLTPTATQVKKADKPEKKRKRVRKPKK